MLLQIYSSNKLKKSHILLGYLLVSLFLLLKRVCVSTAYLLFVQTLRHPRDGLNPRQKSARGNLWYDVFMLVEAYPTRLA